MGIRSTLAKNEPLAITILVLLFVIINGVLVASPLGYLTASRYDAVDVVYSKVDGGVLISETYDIIVNNHYNVLFRSFASSLCSPATEAVSPSCIKVESVTCERGKPYLSTAPAEVYDPATDTNIYGTLSSTIKGKIMNNEVGCYDVMGYDRDATEHMTISYIISDDMFKRASAAYPGDYMHGFFSKDHFAVAKITATGFDGQTHSERFILANSPFTINAQTGEFIRESSMAMYAVIALMSIPLIIFLCWYFLGRDHTETVPEQLHYIPDEHMEGWHVDLLIHSGNSISKDGLGSLMLALDVKDMVKVEEEGGLFKSYKVTIKKANMRAGTPKENSLIDCLLQFKESEDDKNIYARIRNNDRRMRIVFMPFLTGHAYGGFSTNTKKNHGTASFSDMTIQEFGNEVFDKKGLIVAILSTVVLALFGMIILAQSSDAIKVIIFAYVFILLIFPQSVLIRFKKKYYTSFLQWHAFRKFLNNTAMLKKYLREDYQMWKAWLYYATAMGVATKLLKTMKELNVITATEYNHYYGTYMVATSFSTSTSASSGASGGGAGGGAGGGGGGGR